MRAGGLAEPRELLERRPRRDIPRAGNGRDATVHPARHAPNSELTHARVFVSTVATVAAGPDRARPIQRAACSDSSQSSPIERRAPAPRRGSAPCRARSRASSSRSSMRRAAARGRRRDRLRRTSRTVIVPRSKDQRDHRRAEPGGAADEEHLVAGCRPALPRSRGRARTGCSRPRCCRTGRASPCSGRADTRGATRRVRSPTLETWCGTTSATSSSAQSSFMSTSVTSAGSAVTASCCSFVLRHSKNIRSGAAP